MSVVDYMKFAENMELIGFRVRGTSIFKSQKVKVLNHCMIVFTFLLFVRTFEDARILGVY